MRLVRSDALPESLEYIDDGCDVHPECLSCPLPRCRYDEPGGLRALLNSDRDRQIIELRTAGVSVDQIAGRYALSRRTVFRILTPVGNAPTMKLQTKAKGEANAV